MCMHVCMLVFMFVCMCMCAVACVCVCACEHVHVLKYACRSEETCFHVGVLVVSLNADLFEGCHAGLLGQGIEFRSGVSTPSEGE